MSHRVAVGSLVLGIAACALGLGGPAAEAPKKADPASLNDLSLEVSALQVLHSFKATREQLEKLRKVTAKTADDSSPRLKAKASEEYRKALVDLRAALLEGKDDKRIGELTEKLENLRDSEKPELDDGVGITDEARDRAPEVLRLLTPHQVALYLGNFADSIPDPVQRILDALKKARGLGPKEWKALRNETSDEVSRLVAGMDPDQAGRVGDKVVQLLIVARGLKDEEFKAQLPELEKTARQIAGEGGPFEVLRHVMEYDLAQLLSNPRLPAVLDARLK